MYYLSTEKVRLMPWFTTLHGFRNYIGATLLMLDYCKGFVVKVPGLSSHGIKTFKPIYSPSNLVGLIQYFILLQSGRSPNHSTVLQNRALPLYSIVMRVCTLDNF